MTFLRSHRRELIVIWSFAVVINFIMANDSFTHELFKHYDEAWFYMCGKAWANGMTPYLDFADSKGPLLWLIYAAGYLISPTDYTGVWLLSVPVYLFCFTYCYRVMLLLSGGERKVSVMATLAMAVPYFTGFHFEMRTEDWCQPAVIYGIYLLLRALCDGGKSPRAAESIAMGAMVVCCLMMKWTIAAVALLPAVAVVCTASSSRRAVLSALWMLAGGVAALVPFAAIFAWYGNFDAFVQEYFMSTSATIKVSAATYMGDLFALLTTIRVGAVIIAAGAAVASVRVAGRRGWWLGGCAVASVLIAACNDHAIYYQAVNNSYAVGIVYLAVRWLHGNSAAVRHLPMGVSYAAIVALLTAYAYVLHPSFIPSDRPETFYKACGVMASMEHPRVLNYRMRETGVGINAETLPATKYWAYQGGATEAMRADQDSAVRAGAADFVVANMSDAADTLFIASGYKPVMTFREYDDSYVILSRHDITVSDGDFRPTMLDRLLKRPIEACEACGR